MVITMKFLKIDLKKLIFYVGLTEIIGFVGSLLGGNTDEVYKDLVKPPLSPPSIVFPIIWGILYLILGISAYLFDQASRDKAPLRLYWVQIVLNSLWTMFFFRFQWLTFSAIWIVLLIVLSARLTVQFRKESRTASWLFLPYLAWLFFALYLNIGFAGLN